MKKIMLGIGIAVIAANALLLGVGAYLQSTSGSLFDEMRDNASSGVSAEKMEQYMETAERSENLKKGGRIVGYGAILLALLLVAMHRIKATQYSALVGTGLVLGVLSTLPWCLKSGDGLPNYYHEQFFVILAGIIGIGLAFGIALATRGKKESH